MIQRILVAVDGSSRTAHVVRTAAAIAERFDAVLILFRAVVVPPEFPPGAHVSHVDPLPKYLDDTARTELAALAAPLTVRKEPPVVAHGQPWRAIIAAADQHDVDLVVVGSHGYHGADRVLGTTAARVADRSPRNVLVVHDEGDRKRIGGPAE